MVKTAKGVGSWEAATKTTDTGSSCEVRQKGLHCTSRDAARRSLNCRG